MKVGLVGIGGVGRACLLALVTSSSAQEIVVVNRDRARAEGTVTDIQYGAALIRPVKLLAGEYPDLQGADLVIVTAGINERTGGATDRNDPKGRLRLLSANAEIYRDLIPKILKAAADAILLIVTDPPDALADLARETAGHERVLSAGTFLDTQRFRFHLAEQFGVHPSAVEAQVVGEHGISQVFLWSSARIGGAPIRKLFEGKSNPDFSDFKQRIEREVRYANITIIEGSGASQLGIGLVTARLANVILRDERLVLPVGSYHPNYGTTLSLPTMLGRRGIIRTFDPDMDDGEAKALQRSAEVLRQAVQQSRV